MYFCLDMRLQLFMESCLSLPSECHVKIIVARRQTVPLCGWLMSVQHATCHELVFHSEAGGTMITEVRSQMGGAIGSNASPQVTAVLVQQLD